jgi:signal recognition particle subunit SEC65
MSETCLVEPTVAEANTISTAKLQASTWNELCDHLNHWYYQPDLQALAATLTCAVAHAHVQADPLWLFVIGPSRSGKTAININALSLVTGAYVLSKLTPRTFLSGYHAPRKGGHSAKQTSLLLRLGANPLLLFKDFTSVLSMRDDDRLQIASDLREIYDGLLSKPTGMGDDLVWKGKVTVVAVCTPALDRAWAIQRDLGERFLCVRWHRRDGPEVARRACAQRGHEKEITNVTKQLGSKMVSQAQMADPPVLSAEQGRQLNHLAEIVALARGRVNREGGKNVTEPPEPEEASGIAKGLDGFARYHAALFGRTTVTAEDIALAYRVAHDSIPPVRQRALASIPDGASVEFAEIEENTGLPSHGVRRAMEDLDYLGIINTDKRAAPSEYHYEFTKSFLQLRKVVYPERFSGKTT